MNKSVQPTVGTFNFIDGRKRILASMIPLWQIEKQTMTKPRFLLRAHSQKAYNQITDVHKLITYRCELDQKLTG